MNRHISQEVCPFNVRFAEESAEPGYAARGPGELPTGVEALPGEGSVAGTARRDASAETRAALQAAGDHRGTGGDASTETSVRAHAHPGTAAPSLVELMRMTREDWDVFSRGSAIRRAGYADFKRNVAVAMGNWLASVEEPPEVAVLREAGSTLTAPPNR